MKIAFVIVGLLLVAGVAFAEELPVNEVRCEIQENIISCKRQLINGTIVEATGLNVVILKTTFPMSEGKFVHEIFNSLSGCLTRLFYGNNNKVEMLIVHSDGTIKKFPESTWEKAMKKMAQECPDKQG